MGSGRPSHHHSFDQFAAAPELASDLRFWPHLDSDLLRKRERRTHLRLAPITIVFTERSTVFWFKRTHLREDSPLKYNGFLVRKRRRFGMQYGMYILFQPVEALYLSSKCITIASSRRYGQKLDGLWSVRVFPES